MERLESGLFKLGTLVAEEQNAHLADAGAIRLRQVRHGLMSHPVRPRFRAPWQVLVPALSLAGALAGGMLVLRSRTPLSFAVEDGKTTIGVGTPLTAPATARLPVRFSEGTRITLDPSARAKVDHVYSTGAEVTLESGRVRLAVVHRPNARWRLHAGPFDVRVTGTKFSVDWNERQELFVLQMEEGSVVVTGHCVDGERRPTGTDRVVLSCRRETMVVPLAAPPAAAPVEAPRPDVALVTPPPHRPVHAGTVHAMAAPAPSWQELYEAGKVHAAFATAVRLGFAHEVRQASPADLLKLGDSARLSLRVKEATLALITLRDRSSGTPARAKAAYLLGRLAADQKNDPAEAASWFTTYLKEQPGGPLAEEAEGCRLDATRRAGDAGRARTLARGYLSRYPDGAYVKLAHGVLGE